MIKKKPWQPWWRHQMETFSALLAICAGNSPVTGGIVYDIFPVTVTISTTQHTTTLYYLSISITDIHFYLISYEIKRCFTTLCRDMLCVVMYNDTLKFVPKFRINEIPALVQIMAWRRPGDKPLSEPMMVSLLTHIWVSWPEWVNITRHISTQQITYRCTNN